MDLMDTMAGAEVLIPLGHGKWARIDLDDLPLVAGRAWHATGGYARCGSRHGREYMHRRILDPLPEGQECDHINGDGLDNRRANLRAVTHSENLCNRGPCRGRRYKGIYWHKAAGHWSAKIEADGRQYHLGLFATEEDAARAYNEAAIKYHNPAVARLNDV